MSYSSACAESPKRCEMDGLSLAAPGRLRSALALACLVALIALGALASGGAAPGLADDPPDAVPGELVVGFTPSSTEKQQQKAVNKVGATIEDRIDSIGGALV